jgi:hypothetical protein
MFRLKQRRVVRDPLIRSSLLHGMKQMHTPTRVQSEGILAGQRGAALRLAQRNAKWWEVP